MAGYATLSPALAGGPPGWVLWAVGGTVLTVGALWATSKAVDMARSRVGERAEPRVIPRAVPCERCEPPRPYAVRVHAQGRDCGGTSSSTIGAPPYTRIGVPITSGEGVALSAATWAILNRSQRSARTLAKARLDTWVLARPPGGFLGQKTFPASDPSGGKRYDVDSYGPSNNFVT
jgi:hypothetical protein